MNAYGAKLGSHGLIALLGRDLLTRCVLIYNGPDSTFTFAV